jgi:hypothetical protein
MTYKHDPSLTGKITLGQTVIIDFIGQYCNTALYYMRTWVTFSPRFSHLLLCTYEGWATSSLCTMTTTDLLCFPFGLTLYQSCTSSELENLAYGGMMIVIRHHKNWPRWRNHKWAIASQSQRTCVADSSSSRHLSHMGLPSTPLWRGVPLDESVL